MKTSKSETLCRPFYRVKIRIPDHARFNESCILRCPRFGRAKFSIIWPVFALKPPLGNHFGPKIWPKNGYPNRGRKENPRNFPHTRAPLWVFVWGMLADASTVRGSLPGPTRAAVLRTHSPKGSESCASPAMPDLTPCPDFIRKSGHGVTAGGSVRGRGSPQPDLGRRSSPSIRSLLRSLLAAIKCKATGLHQNRRQGTAPKLCQRRRCRRPTGSLLGTWRRHADIPQKD
jgi:hypothetical protein